MLHNGPIFTVIKSKYTKLPIPLAIIYVSIYTQYMLHNVPICTFIKSKYTKLLLTLAIIYVSIYTQYMLHVPICSYVVIKSKYTKLPIILAVSWGEKAFKENSYK